MKSLKPDFIKAEAASSKLLDKFGIDDPGFDVIDVAYALGINVEYGGVENADAWLLRRNDGTGVIRLNENVQEPTRIRFSIAHEIGHWLMHPELQQGFLCTAQNFRDYARSPEEAEANWFAATLLMPKFLLPMGEFKKDPSFEIISSIASSFQTSLTATARRFVQLSKFAVVLVSSTDGRISWSLPSQSARWLFIKWGSQLPEGSISLDSFQQKIAKTSLDSVPPDVWFPDMTITRDTELFEQARFSVEYNNSLTLLWLP